MDETTILDTVSSLVVSQEYLAAENRQLKEERDERLARARERKLKGRGVYFTRIIHDPCQKLIRSKTLTQMEKAFLFTILPFLQHQTNRVINEDKTLMNTNQMAELTGISSRHMRDIIRGLEEKGVLCRVKNGRQVGIRLNPDYFQNGEAISEL